MNLNMQGAPGAPQNLPVGDSNIVTGPMSDCVSIIALYNYSGAVNVRYIANKVNATVNRQGNVA